MLKSALAAVIVVLGLASAPARADVLRLGVEGAYPPFSETLPSGEIVGFDIDIAFALCKEIGATCELVPQAWEGMIPALLERKYDAIVASLSITPERKQVVDFTDRYYKTPGAFMAPKGITVDTSKAGLKGKVIGVQVATVSACYLEDQLTGTATIKQYDTQENANLDLIGGRLDLVFADLVTLKGGFLNRPEGAAYEIKGPTVYDEKCMGEGIGVAVRKEDTALKQRFNQAIKALRANGTYQAINAKYFDFDLYGD